MHIVNIREAKATLATLVEDVARGEDVVIAIAGKPAARLVPMVPVTAIRTPGALKGKIRIADDFDAPLPADVQAGFDAS